MRVKNIKTNVILDKHSIDIGRHQFGLPHIIISDGDNYVLELDEPIIVGLVSMLESYKQEIQATIEMQNKVIIKSLSYKRIWTE